MNEGYVVKGQGGKGVFCSDDKGSSRWLKEPTGCSTKILHSRHQRSFGKLQSSSNLKSLKSSRYIRCEAFNTCIVPGDGRRSNGGEFTMAAPLGPFSRFSKKIVHVTLHPVIAQKCDLCKWSGCKRDSNAHLCLLINHRVVFLLAFIWEFVRIQKVFVHRFSFFMAFAC